MHPGPRVDSKKFDVAVGDNDSPNNPAVRSLCARLNPQFGRRGPACRTWTWLARSPGRRWGWFAI